MKKFFLALSLVAVSVAGAIEFRVEAENIGERSSWVIGNDVGGVDKKMLASKGVGVKNAAKGVYGIPETDRYYVWVRTLTFGEKWRKTEVKFNGKTIGKFGDEGPKLAKPKYTWKRALMPVQLNEGELTIEFIPLGIPCRIDSLIFTTDKEFSPVDKGKDVIEAITEMECAY